MVSNRILIHTEGLNEATLIFSALRLDFVCRETGAALAYDTRVK